MERDSDSMRQIEDSVFGLLSVPLTVGEFRIIKDGTEITAWIKDEPTGQHISVVTRNEHGEADLVRISVIHSAYNEQRPDVTAVLTKGFGANTSYLYYPNSDVQKSLGIADLNMFIKLAIEAQTRSQE